MPSEEMLLAIEKGSAFLAHHGIKGQKWGIRRYQNEDGSLTDAGRERYLKGMNSREKVDYLKSDEATRAAAERYMDQGLTFTEANEQVERDRKERNKKIIIAGAAVIGTALAVYGGYKLYKHLGNEADRARDFYRNIGENAAQQVDKNKDMLYKHWENSDIEQYKDTFRRQGEENAKAVTRGSVLRDKLGIQTKADKSKFWKQNDERQAIERVANRRADLNRSIENQRQQLAGLESKREGFTRNIDEARRGDVFKYDKEKMDNVFNEADASRRASVDRQIEVGRNILDDLLKQRRLLN